MLRAGGNAVDAAVACVLMSFVAESPLTGPGAGGFMLVHVPDGGTHLLDFFVAAPGKGLEDREPAALLPIDVHFSEDADPALQRRPVVVRRLRHHARARAGARALRQRARSADLTAAPARAAREGVEVMPMQAFLFTVLEPILRSTPECEAIYAPDGRPAARGRDDPAARSSATCSSGSAPRGPASSTRATSAAAASDWVLERGGLLTREDLASYEVIERPPARVALPRAARCSPTRRRRRAAS